uniref:Uncharacterized protein n=1 Tax=Plectus sambesii TaxID=2011161 RepID=A0A914UUB8_9BILA
MVTAPPGPSFASRPGGCSRHNEMAPDDSRALFGAPWKLIVIGAPKVGKSSLVYKFACAESSPDAKRREQVEYSTTIPTSGDQMLNLQIFCQPPNSSIDDLDDAFFDGAHGAMFVFSTNDSQVSNSKLE